MDSAHSHPSSPPSTSTNAHTTSSLRSSTSSPRLTTQRSKRYSEPGTSRQQRLLQHRNARFPAKKLSLSNLSSRFSQLIHANDEPQTTPPLADQENLPLSHEISPSIQRHTLTRSLGILDELSSSNGKSRRSGNFMIYQDTPERPLLRRSPFTSPTTFDGHISQGVSPINFDQLQDSLSTMRLREISGNEHRGLSVTSSPLNGSIKVVKKRKSIQTKAGFDSEEYIDHIERELQQARREMYSPTTNKSLKDQLQAARYENERLQQEMAQMRDVYETEVKRSIENKTQMEVELKRQVRDLEEELEQKMSIIRDLELSYEERRLDSNTIETFKTTIERLEQHKLSLEDENRSMTKRNEVLSELLAMSPTKMQSFELRSPVREKRGAGRPMSMIIPKLPSSPNGGILPQPTSAVASPALSAGGPFFRGWRSRPGSPKQGNEGLGIIDSEDVDALRLDTKLIRESHGEGFVARHGRSRRSTMQSQTSLADTASIVSDTSSPIDPTVPRALRKRKPRKFMSGSTQLKPLLLPTLTGEPTPSISYSVPASPVSEALYDTSQDSIDPTTYFLSQPEEPSLDENTLCSDQVDNQDSSKFRSCSITEPCRTFEDIMSQHEASWAADMNMRIHSEYLSEDIGDNLEVGDEDLPGLDHAEGTPSFYQSGKDRVLNYGGAHVQDSVDDATEVLPEPAGFDLNALKHLNLPQPNFDALPQLFPSMDESLLTDVPQPLFSCHGLEKEPLQELSHSAPSTQSQQLTQNATLSRYQHFDQFSLTLGATDTFSSPKTRSSWHAPTSKRWTGSYQNSATESVSSKMMDLPLRSSLHKAETLARAKSPLEILHSGKFGAKPLASLTIRTIFGTIAQCTRQVRDFKRDPLAMARRVLANAWLSHWTRFGRLSWWVLGLFMSNRSRPPKLREWDWTSYDAEEIARRACEQHTDIPTPTSPLSQEAYVPPQHVSHYRQDCDRDSSHSRPKSGWGSSMLLWGKFSVAIMLAVGGAVVKGPGEMLKDIRESEDNDLNSKHTSQATANTVRSQDEVFGRRDLTRFGGDDFRASDSENTHQHSTGLVRSRVDNSPSTRSCHYSSRSLNNSSLSIGDRRDRIVPDEDATLRAIGIPRMGVTGLFRQRESMSSSRSQVTSSQVRGFHSRSPDFANETRNWTLQWPPSLGAVDPEINGLNQY